MAIDASGTEYPPLEGGGSLLVAWQLQGKHVLVIGGGEVASGRVALLLQASAHVTVIAPDPLHPLISHYLATFPASASSITTADPPAANAVPPTPRLRHIAREYRPSDLDTPQRPSMVLTALPAHLRALSTSIYQACHAQCIPVNVADVPPECDFYFGSMIRQGSVQVMVSTNGKGPRLARRVREVLQGAMERDLQGMEVAVERAGKVRARLKQMVPGLGKSDVKGRMDWMIRVSDAYSLDDLREMTDDDMEMLLSYYKLDQVPRLQCLRAAKKEYDPFDGSFGFCIGVG